MANVGYIRVSTEEQNEERQTQALARKGVTDLFTEKISGKNTDRPQLQALLKFIRQGDVVFVESFSRLARNTADLLKLVETIQAKGAEVVSLKENLDTSTPTGKLMLTMIGAIATFERDIMLQRQKEGIAIAKENGVYKGRLKAQKPAGWADMLEQYNNRQIASKSALAKMCGVSRPTLDSWLKEK